MEKQAKINYLKKNIRVNDDGFWIWFDNKESPENLNEITGKYLFFSKDKKALIILAKRLLKEYNLKYAKTNAENKPIGENFVLCIYDKEPRYQKELAKESDYKNIAYRYWKYDKDTREGKYSEKFLKAREDYYKKQSININKKRFNKK